MNDNKEDNVTLSILEAIENKNDMTQRHLADNLGVALGLANSYLKRCVKKGLVKIHQAPANRYLYYLTPKGFTEKTRLTAQYLSTSFEFYRRAGDSCKDIFTKCDKNKWTKILLIGLSELTEIAVLRSHEFKTNIVGIYHPDSTSKTFVGYPVINNPIELPEFDVAVITELSNIESIIDDAHKVIEDKNKILIPEILGVRNNYSASAK
jgi:DNA-binding MarR family transcriptional regulator